MSRSRSVIIAAGLTLVLGCRTIYVIHPLFTATDLVFEPGLLAAWAPAASPGGERWVFLRPDAKSPGYTLAMADSSVASALPAVDFPALEARDSGTLARLRRDPVARAQRTRDSTTITRLYSDSGGPRVFAAGLGRLGGALFLDITADPLNSGPPHLRDLMMPVHWFWRVSLEGDRLSVTPLNEDWLGQMIDSGRVTIAHETQDGRILLTASTGELQRLVAQYAQDTAAFPARNRIELRRLGSGPF
jgi:hypothetical protein